MDYPPPPLAHAPPWGARPSAVAESCGSATGCMAHGEFRVAAIAADQVRGDYAVTVCVMWRILRQNANGIVELYFSQPSCVGFSF